jgi:hypothetical protein
MISKKSQNNMSSEDFRIMAQHFGIAIQANFSEFTRKSSDIGFMDPESFFLSATLQESQKAFYVGF